jgi:hypothetical protein
MPPSSNKIDPTKKIIDNKIKKAKLILIIEKRNSSRDCLDFNQRVRRHFKAVRIFIQFNPLV